MNVCDDASKLFITKYCLFKRMLLEFKGMVVNKAKNVYDVVLSNF